jgi:hypothetical protein
MKRKPQFILILIIALIGVGLSFYLCAEKDRVPVQVASKKEGVNHPISSSSSSSSIATSDWVNDEIKAIHKVASQLNTEVLKVSLQAYQKAKEKGLVHDQIITIVDYSKPSSERRLWVVDLSKNKVLFYTYVAHGKNSGSAETTSFSNSPSSLKSSMGVFLTDETYSGHNGYSLRVKGLEKNINNNAYDRNIVFHGAAYVSSDIAKARGMLGRSWGCFAVSHDMIAPIINAIKHKTLVVAYYPDRHWLKTSSFLR